MSLNKFDYIASSLASISFVGGFLVPFFLMAYVISAEIPWSHDTDAGLILAPIAFIVALPCAWLGSSSVLSRYGRRTGQRGTKETFSLFAILVLASFALTTVIGSISSRAFITIPALLVSLAAAYLIARLVFLKKQSK